MKLENIKKFCSVCGALYFDNKNKYCSECKMKLTKVTSLNHSSTSSKKYVLKLFAEVEQ